MKLCIHIIVVLIIILLPASSFTSDKRTYSSKECSFTLQNPPTIQLNTKEESRIGPVYVVDISRKGRPLALMIHLGHGTLATDSTERLIREIIDSVKLTH